MRHNSKRHRYKYPYQLRSRPREKRSRKKSDYTISWRNLQARDLISLFVLTYWPSWLISQLVSPCTSSFVSRKRQEKHLGMYWLTQNHSWHICQKSLRVTRPSCPECNHVQSKVPAITFIAEDMLLKDSRGWEAYFIPDTVGGILLYRDALQVKEHGSDLSAGNEYDFPWSSPKDGRMLNANVLELGYTQ